MTPTQQRLMIYLADRVDAKSSEIREALQISEATFHLAKSDLIDNDFMRSTKAGSVNVCRYSLTQDGLSVANQLIRYQSYEGQIVQPNRTNKLAGKYEPTYGYQRQCGNKQLRSVGVPC